MYCSLLPDASLRLHRARLGGAHASAHPPTSPAPSCPSTRPQVRKTLNEDGAGRVLVVDNRGSMTNAMVGDRLAEHAYKQGWAGIVVNGCVRDVDEIRK